MKKYTKQQINDILDFKGILSEQIVSRCIYHSDKSPSCLKSGEDCRIAQVFEKIEKTGRTQQIPSLTVT